MAAILDDMKKRGLATELSGPSAEQTTAHFNKTAGYPGGAGHPTGRDSEAGSGSGSTDTELDDGTMEVSLEDPFSAHVRSLVESVGGKYTLPPNAKTITITPTFMAALERLNRAMPLLRAVRRRQAERESAAGSASGNTSGSASGSRSGSASGSASGSESGRVSKSLIERFSAGDRAAGLELMRQK